MHPRARGAQGGAMGGKYASKTNVPVERSKAEIERTLTRYGADQFAYAWSGATAIIAFAIDGRAVRISIPMPDKNDKKFWTTEAGRVRKDPDAALKEWEKACRQRWRAVLLVIKAKLEAVESGISSFEDEFLAHLLLPNNKTFGEWAGPQLRESVARGDMPKALLPGVTDGG